MKAYSPYLIVDYVREQRPTLTANDIGISFAVVSRSKDKDPLVRQTISDIVYRTTNSSPKRYLGIV